MPPADSQNVDAFKVYRDGEVVGQSSQTSYSDSSLAAYSSYEYRVSAVNRQGVEGEKSDSVEVRTPDGSPPEAPADISARAMSAGAVEVSWQAASDPESGVDHYRVYRGGSLVGEPGGTEFEDTGLSTSTTYSYEVSAVNGAGLEGEGAGPRTVETEPDDTPPTEPPDLEAEAEGPTEVRLKWKAASDPESGVVHYRVYRDGSLVGEPGGTEFEDTGLSTSTTYSYEVSAVNGAGLEGERAGPRTAETESDDTPPTEPSDLEAEAEGPTEVELEWEAASDPESGVAYYRIYRNGSLVGETDGTEFEDERLEEDTNYRYQVSAVNGVGLEGPKTSPVTVRTDEDEEDEDDDSGAADAVSVFVGGIR